MTSCRVTFWLGAGPPKYPGDRENVHYSITEVINSEHDQVLRLYNKHKVGWNERK